MQDMPELTRQSRAGTAKASRFVENLDGFGKSTLETLSEADSEDDQPFAGHAVGSEYDTSPTRRQRCVRFRSKSDVFEAESSDGEGTRSASAKLDGRQVAPDYTVSLKSCPEASPRAVQPRQKKWLPRYVTWTFVLVAILVLIHNSPLLGDPIQKIGVQGGPVGRRNLQSRQDTSTNYCTRWSQQTALVNGTLYSYGGRASQSGSQQDNTWNNDFLTLDLTKSWDIGTPPLKGLPQPSGPPAVANGYLWHSYTSLFLYGGEYSDSPVTSPSPFALWEYDIPTSSWKEHTNPQTSPGNNSDGGNQPVQDSAEGAGISVPELGRGWYFGGHQDYLTTAGWSYTTTRIYLKSLIEYTFPGYENNGIQGSAGTPASSDGAWRNVTQGGLQSSDGFTERADGALVYVPGYGEQGIILGLAGGTNTTFTEMNVIDVYDVASSTWYKQSTHGGPPPIRVNPCAVAASAPDGSSTNVYMYGGQALQPAKSQTQYGDMWILTIPSFTWIQVPDSDGAPPPRAGHSCEIWDGQMIVFGGYVGNQITCDNPGIYVFDATNLVWQTSFTALSGGDDQSQQLAQSESSSGLAGSYGYKVPSDVQAVIGGNAAGSATVTTPAVGATAGPLATGTGIVYTATVSGTVVTETAAAANGGGGGAGSYSANGPNVAAIAAGTVAGLLLVLAAYLGFCVYVYRRQLQMYKNHVAASQRAALVPPNEKSAFLFGNRSSEEPSTDRPTSTIAGASSTNPSARTAATPAIEGAPPLHTEAQPLQRRDSTSGSSTEHLEFQEPSFMGVLMRPRRSLRIVNRD